MIRDRAARERERLAVLRAVRRYRSGGMALPGIGSWRRLGSVPPPTLSSVNYDQGDTLGGGESIVLTGTDLTGASSVTIGGTSQTITLVTSTTVTCTLAARAAGSSLDIVVTTPGGSATITGGFEYWSPATIGASCTAFGEKPDYSSAGDGAWTMRVGTTLVSGAYDTPAASSGAPNFDGTNDGLKTGASSGLFTTSGTQEGSFAVVFNADTLAAPAANVYDDEGLFALDTQGVVSMNISTSGVRCFATDGVTPRTTAAQAFSAGTIVTAQFRFLSGGTVDCKLNGGAWDVSAALGTMSITGANVFNIASNYNSAAWFDGVMYAVVFCNTKISDSNGTKIRKWAQQRFLAA